VNSAPAIGLVSPHALADMRAGYPDLHKAEFLMPSHGLAPAVPTVGLAARCPGVHEEDQEATFHAVETDLGWCILPCTAGCSPAEIWNFRALPPELVKSREPGEDDGEPSEPPASVWRFCSATEFLTRKFPPPRWLYMDLVPAESVTVVMAAPNAGKTFFGMDVVAQVAAKAAVAGVRVCIVEEEGTGAALQWRLSRALASVGMSGSELIRVAWNTGRSLRNKADLASLGKDCKGAELIMLDSLSALAGGINENDSEEMAQIAEAIHVLKTFTGSAIMVLHHMTKAAWKDGETPRLEHMRGHGALPGRADAVLALVPLESDEEAVNFELHCVKQRDGSRPKARKFSIAMKGAVATCEIEDKGDPVRRAESIDALHARILAAMAGKNVSKNFLCNIIDGRRDKILKAVDVLENSGRIVQIRRGSYALTNGSGGSGVVPGIAEQHGSPPFKGGTTLRNRYRSGVSGTTDEDET
jgi:hypothetical protein